ncbi:MAG: folate-binding protein YgfZ [Gammaproteobacteria bacterium]|jgi:hypothetical protein|nr:folate-binding protein YgfZ [Gammaproteobacteria bacterium]MBT4605951.1 folate-binding protein YgfZ [Thiotrichales bacterium]MBT3471352.1 folate-binding protein YgfZ [Gammaproteobacteria bacterium]MBT3966798.1 folate-binding protein YgfZ [Gammaproteobacteria bacterium]MBT4080612.1 folate-binding protein YgfZ [Gammaproteobacteria bacterium]
MNSDWKSYLTNNGAELVQDIVVSFGNIEQERHIVGSGDVMCDLSHLAILEVCGEDSIEFLQNQFTNDVATLAVGKSQFDGWCTPKGRLLALFRVTRVAEDRFLLILPRDLVEGVEKKLQMFIFRSKVTINNLSEDAVRIGLSGPKAEAQLSAVAEASPLPSEVDSAVITDKCTIVRLRPGPHPRFLVVTEAEPAQKIWSHFDVQSAPIGRGAWELLKIRAGVPSVFLQTQESFVPQMLNLQAINGLSFQKGCYPGQEVVARMEYLGKLKRKMFSIFIHEESAPTIGSKLYSASSTSAQGAGEVIAIEKDGDGAWEGLAVIEVSAAEADDVTLSEDGAIPVIIIQ